MSCCVSEQWVYGVVMESVDRGVDLGGIAGRSISGGSRNQLGLSAMGSDHMLIAMVCTSVVGKSVRRRRW